MVLMKPPNVETWNTLDKYEVVPVPRDPFYHFPIWIQSSLLPFSLTLSTDSWTSWPEEVSLECQLASIDWSMVS